jgi:hypothetical protein
LTIRQNTVHLIARLPRARREGDTSPLTIRQNTVQLIAVASARADRRRRKRARIS